jgi:hypothetical protein
VAEPFNRLIASRFAEGVRRFFGEDLTVDSVAPEIQLSFGLESLPPELQVIFGIRPWIGQAQVAAGGAGFRSIAQLFNPVGSGVVSVLRRIHALHTVAAAQVFEIRRDDTARGTDSGNLISRDTRTSVRNSTTQLRTINTAALPGGTTILGLEQIETNQGNLLLEDVDIIIAPGVGIIIAPSVDNNALNCTVYGYERAARPEELALS